MRPAAGCHDRRRIRPRSRCQEEVARHDRRSLLAGPPVSDSPMRARLRTCGIRLGHHDPLIKKTSEVFTHRGHHEPLCAQTVEPWGNSVSVGFMFMYSTKSC